MDLSRKKKSLVKDEDGTTEETETASQRNLMLKQLLKGNVSAVMVEILQAEWDQVWLELAYLKMKLKTSSKTVKAAMPAQGITDDAELDAMADYILSLK